MTAYYNEFDKHAAAWLRNLISAGHLPAGEVDERSIAEVQPEDLAGFTQCHFFAGIGGWPYALRLAGWPDDRPVWTGSCPCQPLSSAGQRKGHADERHLWPAFHRLIAERRPAVVFGEQVASADGREWLAGVRADLEATGYAVGAADLCAAGVGAPHIRQRLFWVADADGGLAGDRGIQRGREQRQQQEDGRAGSGVGNADAARPQAREREGLSGAQRLDQGGAARQPGRAPGADSGLGHADDQPEPKIEVISAGKRIAIPGRAGAKPWDGAAWLPCSDGKARRVEPSIFPLAHGVSGRVGRLRAYGNAIVPQAAAEFVTAFLEAKIPRP